RQWYAQQGCLRAANALPVYARRLVARLAVWAGVVGGEERANNELSRFDRRDRAADLLHDAAVLVAHRGRLCNRRNAAVGPQVGPAHAGSRDADESVRRVEDRWVGTLLKAHVSGTVKHGSSHDESPSCSGRLSAE